MCMIFILSMFMVIIREKKKAANWRDRVEGYDCMHTEK